MPFLGHEHHPGPPGPAGAAEFDGPAVDGDGAAGDRVGSAQRADELALPVALHPGEAEDLVAGQRGGDPAEPVRAQVTDLHHDVADRGGARREQRVDLPSRDAGDDLLLGHLRGEEGAADLPVAQHGETVGQGHHVGQPVADVDHRHPVGGELPDLLEQPLDLGHHERLGGLVEDQDAGLAGEGSTDLDGLLLGEGQPAGRGGRVDVHPHGQQLFPGPVLGVAEGRAEPFRHAQQEVLGDREIGEKRRMLEGDGQALLPGGDRGRLPHRRARDLDGARVGCQRTGGHRHERGLSGAVPADQGVYLARVRLEIDPVERDHAGEAFGHSTENQSSGRFDHAKDHSLLRLSAFRRARARRKTTSDQL
ncbi:hypothetical protein GCM10018952_02420 [Streptosporangium vulgare]